MFKIAKFISKKDDISEQEFLLSMTGKECLIACLFPIGVTVVTLILLVVV